MDIKRIGEAGQLRSMGVVNGVRQERRHSDRRRREFHRTYEKRDCMYISFI